jgi:hypothetical protein
LFTQLINAGNGPVIRDGVDAPASRPGTRFRASQHPIEIRPSSRHTTSDSKVRDDVTATTQPVLELDDVQAGALYERPSPYVGTHLLLRIDDRNDGRKLVRRLHAIVGPGQDGSYT